MRKTSVPFASRLRQLHHLEKRAKAFSEINGTPQNRRDLILKFRVLLRKLRTGLHAKWWLRSALCIAMYLQISLQEMAGQQFAEPIKNPFGITGVEQAVFFKAVDFDSDGDNDILGLGYDYIAGEYKLQYFENIGNAGENAFADPVSEAFGFSFEGVTSYAAFLADYADLDNDGDLDILASIHYEYDINSGTYNQLFAYYENSGTPEQPQFGDPQLLSLPSIANHSQGFVQFADIDEDGDFDLFSTALSSYYSIDPYILIQGLKTVYYENSGTPEEFQFDNGVMHPFNLHGLEDPLFNIPDFGDLDGDGDLDVLMSNLDPYTEVGNFVYQENLGTPESPDFGVTEYGPFQLPVSSPVGHLIQLVDFDFDGDLDIFSTGYNYENGGFDIYYIENIEPSNVANLEHFGVEMIITPNPVEEFVSIHINGVTSIDQLQIQVIDQTGRVVEEEQISNFTHTFEVNHLPPGIYTAHLFNRQGQLTRKFVKKE